MTIADLYVRKSNKDDGRSIAGQEDDYRDDCEAEGLEMGRTFADPDKSSSRFARKPRPDYQALIEHISSGACQLLSMWESSRGSRKLADWVSFLDLCRDRGTLIRIISHERTYDVRKRRDYRTLAEEGINSADESELLSERITRGKRVAAKEGRPVGRLAFGFKRIYDDRGKFVKQVEHPDQAPVVREIVQGLADGKTAGSIARSLNNRGVPVPQVPCAADCNRDHAHFRDMTWTDSQVRTIAVRAAYAGKRIHRGTVFGDGKWEPIVDPDVWAKAHAIVTSPKRHVVIDTRIAHWLTGAVFCGLCGGRMQASGAASSSRYCCRECTRSSASTRGLEGFLEPILLERFALDDVRGLWAPATDKPALAAAEAELKRLEDRLADYRAEGAKPDGLSAAAVAEAERGLAPYIDAARRKVKELGVPPALAGKDIDPLRDWADAGPLVRRELVLRAAHIVLAPGERNGRKTFDPWRLAGSRWTGDERTWGEIWAA